MANKVKVITNENIERDSYLNERIPVLYPKSHDKSDNEIHCHVNGKMFIIKRGEQVLIPRYVDMAINDALEQQNNAENLIDEASKTDD